jgi:hypothetical protein
MRIIRKSVRETRGRFRIPGVLIPPPRDRKRRRRSVLAVDLRPQGTCHNQRPASMRPQPFSSRRRRLE